MKRINIESIEEPSERFVIYTAIANGYDFLRPAPKNLPDVDFICFTDDVGNKMRKGWTLRAFPQSQGLDHTRKCRNVKLRPHLYLSDYKYTLWIDANILVKPGVKNYISDFIISQNTLATFKHPFRNCIYEEAMVCKKENRDDHSSIDKLTIYLRSKKYPQNLGLIESNVLFRSTHDNLLTSAMEMWWEMVLKFSKRDQLSFNYVAWKMQLPYVYINGSTRTNDGCFKLQSHRTGTVKDLYYWLEANNSSIVTQMSYLVLSTLKKRYVERKRSE